MTAVARVYRWEVAKLLAQKRTFLGLGAAIAVPIIFVVVLLLQRGGPTTSRSADRSATPAWPCRSSSSSSCRSGGCR